MISRRDFLKAVAAGVAVYPFKHVVASQKTDRMLNMYNIHTDKSLNIKYCASGIYDTEALNRINYFLRCHYTNEVRAIDVRLLDLLCEIQGISGEDKQVHIISGYRSFEYNEYLRRQGSKVAKESLHLQGLAIDFSIPGISTDRLFGLAKSLAAGGVGKYPEFVHIDLGRIRYW